MELKELQDKHKDEIIFVVGSGPSMKDIDNDILKDEIVIAVNGGISKIPFAQYIISDDRDIMSWSYFDIVRKSNCICLFYEDKFKNYIDNSLKERTIFYKHKSWFSPPDIYNLPDGLVLTKDVVEPIVGSRTSAGSGVHMAYCMGAKVIVLLGNDCRLSNNKFNYRYYWQFPGEQKQYRIKGRKFTPQTQNRGFDKDSFVEYWNYFAEVNKDSDINIIDASDSCLDCFPKMSIREVLDNYK
jgi:hypothetical protein